MDMRSEEGVSGTMRDTDTGKVQAHPAPKALHLLGIHTFPSGSTSNFIQQGRRQGPTPAEETTFERGGRPSHSAKRDQCFLYRVEETEAQRRR